MPIDAAATSLPRSASSDAAGRAARAPQITTMLTSARTISDSTRKALSPLLKSIEPSSGPGRDDGRVPAADPAELHDHVLEEERERERRQRQEDAAEPQHREREQRADDRRDERADEHRDEHRTRRAASRAARSRTRRSPANVAWHSEISPAMPVITVIDRKMIDEDRRPDREVDPRARSAWKKRQ